MPELPEVETTLRQLRKKIKGKAIAQVKILSPKQFPQPASSVKGAKITDLARWGKMLVIKLEKEKTLLVHLKLTGQLIFAPKTIKGKAVFQQEIPLAKSKILPGRTTRVIIFFTDQSALFFNDLRKFGWIKLVTKEKANQEKEKIGPEPLDKQFTSSWLKKIFSSSKRAIKLVLIDQNKIGGIGNIYANEALFEAKISPLRPANSLTEKEIAQLRKAIIKVLKAAINYQGTSAADDAYVRPDGQRGRFQDRLQVYQQEGESCPSCSGKIERIKQGGRSSFYCPRCQK